MMKRWSASLGMALKVCGAALIAAVLATWPLGSAQAMLLPEDIASVRAPIKISLSLPSGGPLTRAGHLADRKAKTYLMKASVSRKIAAPRDLAPSASGQLAWIAMLLATVCGAIMVLGRQLPVELTVGGRGSRRRV